MPTAQQLFEELYIAPNEEAVEKVINGTLTDVDNFSWHPLGDHENNFGVIENQQSNPIAALIEKITNSIDAILTRKCYEAGIDPKSMQAPRSIKEAIVRFFPGHINWDRRNFRRIQAEDIQILADGSKRDPSVIIYDNGEGQHPHDFEKTFLSLLRGNKNEIHFVQGKYNMGGSGSIVFCGSKGFQLIASKRFDGSGKFGFTLIREHPLTKDEEKIKKNTWYEFLKIHGEIPAFNCDELDLKLHNRKFKTGTIIKMYSYQFPTGIYGFAQELNQSITEFLFDPALPLLTVDRKERYPNNKVLDLDLFGLKRRLEAERETYLEASFSEQFIQDDSFGNISVHCYVFKNKIEDKDVLKTREIIRDRFFKNNMSVVFSINGQVHGHYTSEFITRSLKFNLLKNHLLIHVDCTEMHYSFRKELFMASRDRLKDGKETSSLRKFLAENLGAKKGRLAEIEKQRRDSISITDGSTKELLRSFTQKLPINSDLLKLLNQTFNLEQKSKKQPQKSKSEHKSIKNNEKVDSFRPQRFPSYLKLRTKQEGDKVIAQIPLNGDRIFRFETDVEDYYFDRVEEPGELQIALLGVNNSNDSSGGTDIGSPKSIEQLINVTTSSPQEGIIKVVMAPTKETRVGDTLQVKVTLTAPGKDFEAIFHVKISEPEAPKEAVPVEKPIEDENIGFPELILVYKEPQEHAISWSDMEAAIGERIDYSTVVYPLSSGEILEKIYINMDSTVIKNFLAAIKNPNESQLEIARKKYISSTYFHVLFLYSITNNLHYRISKESKDEEDISVSGYLKELFQSYYAEFLLNFGTTNDLLIGMGE